MEASASTQDEQRQRRRPFGVFPSEGGSPAPFLEEEEKIFDDHRTQDQRRTLNRHNLLLSDVIAGICWSEPTGGDGESEDPSVFHFRT